MILVLPSFIYALVYGRLVDRLDEYSSLAGTVMVFLRRMLLTYEMVMIFVMKDKCIDVDSTLLRLVFRV